MVGRVTPKYYYYYSPVSSTTHILTYFDNLITCTVLITCRISGHLCFHPARPRGAASRPLTTRQARATSPSTDGSWNRRIVVRGDCL